MTSMSFKGVTAADMGVVVLDYPPIIKPQARIKTVTVPGRSGTLTLHDSEVVYEPVDKTIRCRMLSTASQVAVTAWLSGAGDLILGNEPLYRYTARVVDAVSYEKIMPGYVDRVFDVTFVCQPWKELTTPGADIELGVLADTIIVAEDEFAFAAYGIMLLVGFMDGTLSLVWEQTTTHALKRLVSIGEELTFTWQDISAGDIRAFSTKSPFTLVSPATLDSLPLIQISGVGAVSVNIGSYSFTLSGIESGVPVLVDCDAMTVTNVNQSVSYLHNMVGQFPRLVPGNNLVTWSGTVSSVTIRPRYRWL